MSEIMNTLVSSLNAVRSDYNDRLKTVPQYEAFLMVETSTQKAFEALRGLLDAAKPSMAGEVMSSLENAKSKFKEHLHTVAEYRALLAIDKLIGDVSNDAGEQPTAVPATMIASLSEPSSQEVAATEPETPVATSTPKPAEPAGTLATSALAAIQSDPVAVVAAPLSSITPSVITEVGTIDQDPTERNEIYLAALARAISQPEGLAADTAAHATTPAAPPYRLSGLPIVAMDAETETASTTPDEATTDAVAEQEAESDASATASSEPFPATPYDSDAEKAA